MAARKTKKALSEIPYRKGVGPGCRVHPKPIESLGGFFDICSGVLRDDTEFWFRGHADFAWTLTPSALRYKTAEKRSKALDLLADFKRYVKIKLSNLPTHDEELEWVQLARHYGLPTRLLDWTRNAAIALYCASQQVPASRHADGAVFVLNPKDLNRQADEGVKNPRIFDAHTDVDRIKRYLALSGDRNPRGVKTIAINPVWNSERILLQQGVFTLHGSRDFTLTRDQAPSLVCLRVPVTRKEALLRELERAGINEMSIFPEPDHICSYLIWRERLDAAGAS